MVGNYPGSGGTVETGSIVYAAQQGSEIGRVGPIGKEQIQAAEQTLREYKQGKYALENRIIENDQWYKMRHWGQIKRGSKNPGDPEPTSAYLFNSIANKHADAMDSYPVPNVFPREQSDEADAELLSSILPVVLEQNNYEQTYSDMWWYKLKTGTGVTGVFWSPTKNNGLGDIDIRDLDLLNLFWEPGITHIQKSKNIFHVDVIDMETAEQRYPFLADALLGHAIDIAQYVHDENLDTTKKTTIVDWYYKVSRNGRDVLHYCKFCCGEVIYASENDPEYAERGYYDHGKYPFVFDTLFPEPGMPTGFGYIDICKSPQMYIDKMDQVLMKHAVMGARQRFFVRADGSINEDEYAELTKDFVHYSGSGDPRDSIIPIEIPPISGIYMDVRNTQVEQMKETSGNRDFSQGSTASGVTAASAIAALQEAGNKLSRDMIKSSYRAFSQIGYLCIDLIRQFYTGDRWFRVVGKRGETKFVQFSGQSIAAKPQGNEFGIDFGYRMPIFDIRVTAQKSSPFSTVAQNERAKELYGMGFFRPDLADQALAALDMMDFEGIDKVRDRITQNSMLYQQVQQMSQLLMSMSAELDALKGSAYTPQVAQMIGMQAQGTPISGASGASGAETQENALGDALSQARNSTAGAAREREASASTPKV